MLIHIDMVGLLSCFFSQFSAFPPQRHHPKDVLFSMTTTTCFPKGQRQEKYHDFKEEWRRHPPRECCVVKDVAYLNIAQYVLV